MCVNGLAISFHHHEKCKLLQSILTLYFLLRLRPVTTWKMTDASALLCTTIKRASRWVRSDGVVAEKSSTAHRAISSRPIGSESKKFTLGRSHIFRLVRSRLRDSLIGRRPLQGLVGNIREMRREGERQDTQGEHWQAGWTHGLPNSPSSAKCELFDKTGEGSRGGGGGVSAGHHVGWTLWCLRESLHSKLFDPWFNIRAPLSPSLSLSVPLSSPLCKCCGCYIRSGTTWVGCGSAGLIRYANGKVIFRLIPQGSRHARRRWSWEKFRFHQSRTF